MRLRARLLTFALLSGFAVVGIKAARTQLFERGKLTRLAAEQTRRQIEWAPRRGQIEDRRGHPLAVTLDVDSVFADPSAFASARERELAAMALAHALHLDARKLAQKLAEGDRQFVWVARRIDEAAAERVRALHLDGVTLVKEPKRFYPQGVLAAQVLGRVGEQGGQEGLEAKLDALLRGKAVTVSAIRDARGTLMLPQGAPDPTQLKGDTVTLTLDAAVQSATERELAKAVTGSHAAGGWAVVLDVQSGAVLSMASVPQVDPNRPVHNPAAFRNRAVEYVLEPGSTIKSFVVSAAMQEGLLRPDELLYCEHGKWKHNGHTLHDEHPLDWARPPDILEKSSNICAAKIGERLGATRLFADLRAFGFGERTEIGLPDEGRGSLPDPRRVSAIGVNTAAFGQGMSATGLQAVAAMAAIANGGVLLKPYLVERVVAPDGREVLHNGRTEVRRVLSPQVARDVTAMLEQVVQHGTGTRAALAEFRVAGKTGTAQKVDPGHRGYGNKRLSSFLGFVPADAPRVAILVSIDEPAGKLTGGVVAAPAWAGIAREALRQEGVLPAGSEVADLSAPAQETTLADTVHVSADLPPEPSVELDGLSGAAEGVALVPELSGLSARAAVDALSKQHLVAELRGSGRVVGQQPSAGASVQPGTRVRVTLAPFE